MPIFAAMVAQVKTAVAQGLSLPIMEHFYTIQGEGANAGMPAYFIRTAGCDVGCVWCDVKESWNADQHPVHSIADLVNTVRNHGAGQAVITGGEPCMYNLEGLTAALHNGGIRTWLETSGAHPISGKWDWLVFSPKKFKKPLDEAYRKAHELKVVIANRNDFRWAEQHAERMHHKDHLFLQVEWSRRERLMPLIIDYVKKHPHWRISVQSHKYIGVP